MRNKKISQKNRKKKKAITTENLNLRSAENI